MQRPLWVLTFALALLLSQSLGLLHRAAGQPAQAHSHASAHQPGGHLDGHSPHGSKFLDKLFAGHASDADCQIFDQLSFSDAACALLAVGLSLALTSVLCALLQGLASTRWHAQFQARGPPFSR